MARKRVNSTKEFRCRSCGKWYNALPLHYGTEAPFAYYDVPAAERDERCQLNADFGWSTSRLPAYPDTLNPITHVHTRNVGRRPYIELEPTEHPLAVEQRAGIRWDRVREIAELVLHPKEAV